jgi:microsomal dipeptidase-like Zn-dependent dipeptidase
MPMMTERIADLHCHYPMHLLPAEKHPHDVSGGFLSRLKVDLEDDAERLLAKYLNDRSPKSGWRVDLDGLRAGGARLVCSVLYAPPDEFDIDRRYGAPPGPGYFDDLQNQLEDVELDLDRLDPDGQRHVVVRHVDDLVDDGRVAFVHCVEGGFHLGGDEAAIDQNVRWLAEHGVVYVTLAHLFFRDVATNAPAIPLLSDSEYNTVFPQPHNEGLTPLGEAAVRAMYRHKVLVDISHMSERSIDDTFVLLEQLDQESGAAADDFPVLATHVGVRQVGDQPQEYNLTGTTISRVQSRGGLIGLIMAQHQLGETSDPDRSRVVLRRHVDALAELTGGHGHTAIGTDLDGFIKPTLAGIESASDLATLTSWLREDYPDAADGILWQNADRLLRRLYASRG